MNTSDINTDKISIPQIGDQLRPLIIKPTHAQLFMFSAVTWNRHPIHYSQSAAVAEGHPDVLVQRGLIGNFFARMLKESFPITSKIKYLNWKVINSAIPGDELNCHGTILRVVTTKTGWLLDCEVTINKQDGQSVATGQAKVESLR